MSDEKPKVYYNGFRPKSESGMYQHGKAMAENPPVTDYANSHRMRRKLPAEPVEKPKESAAGQIIRQAAGGIVRSTDGFFRATLKQAIETAITTVVDPAIRNFLDDTITNIKNTLIWGKDAKRIYTASGGTDYRRISTGEVTPRAALPPGRGQMTADDHAYQKYEKLSKPTLDMANAVMSKLYRTLRVNGRVTLAEYYAAFEEPYSFVDESYGWTSLPDMYAVYFNGGYHIIMPTLEVLDSDIRR